jgi:hypothetical protein
MELLALRWQDVGFDGGYLHVRYKLRRKGGLKELKTDAGTRDVCSLPATGDHAPAAQGRPAPLAGARLRLRDGGVSR